MRALFVSILPLIAFLTACSAKKDFDVAQGEVDRFHQMLDAGHFVQIYSAAGPEIRQDMSEPQFVTFLAGVHNGLGKVTKTNATRWNANYGTSGNLVTLTYDTQFARGGGEETFVFSMRDGKATLAGYHIKSKPPGS